MKRVKLGECATYINGYAFKPSEWKKKGIPIVRIQDLTGSMQNQNFYDGVLDEKYLINNDDILISWSGSLGVYEWQNGKAYLNQHIFKVKFDKIDINKKYFVYLIKSKLNEMLKSIHGSTMKHITKNDFDKIEVRIPELEEQKKISNKIDKVQEIIDTRKKQIEELDKLIKFQFVEMFGDINVNDKNWTTDLLKNHLKVIGGYAFKSSEFKENGVPVLRIGNINTGVFRPKDLMFWEDTDFLENYAIYPGDLLMSLTGTVGKEDYGNVCIIGNDYNKYYLNQRNAKLIIKGNLNKQYLAYSLKIPEIKKRLTGISRGVRQANIANRDIENLLIPIPPIDIQNKFDNIVQQIDKQKFEIQKSLNEMQKLQKSLMNKYFN